MRSYSAVGDHVYERITSEDRSRLRAFMQLANGDDENSPEFCTISNMGTCVPGRAPFSQRDLREMLADSAYARVQAQSDRVDWDCILSWAFGAESRERLRELFEEATGRTDADVFGP